MLQPTFARRAQSSALVKPLICVKTILARRRSSSWARSRQPNHGRHLFPAAAAASVCNCCEQPFGGFFATGASQWRSQASARLRAIPGAAMSGSVAAWQLATFMVATCFNLTCRLGAIVSALRAFICKFSAKLRLAAEWKHSCTALECGNICLPVPSGAIKVARSRAPTMRCRLLDDDDDDDY